jgi:Xaa-Pro aminopeptidase
MTNAEAVSEKFSAEKLESCQTKTWELVHKLRGQIKPGMTEAEANEIYKSLQQQTGAEKYWHPPKIRFGKNTMCAFRDPSAPDVKLKNDDIFFLDIGPIYDGYEGDCGQTYTLGNFPEGEKIIFEGERIFKKVSERFQQTGQSGAELYEYAEQLAADAGYELVGEGAKGHRVSDFPHAVFHRGSLKDYKGSTTAHRWILEIQLRDQKSNIGAFFEDILR